MAHIHEKIDFTASVFIVHEGKVLLHMHKKLGKWLQPGGHIELDQGPDETARKEVREETGLEVELIGSRSADATIPGDTVPPVFINRHHFNETHEHIDFTYFGRVVGGELRPEEGTNTAFRWLSREEIETNTELWPTTKAYALAALDALGGVRGFCTNVIVTPLAQNQTVVRGRII